ncbi:MAG: hypothetical protein WC692_07385 [Erythrobacter sp.]|jgi:hypothetical protein
MAERLGEALLDLRTNDAGFTQGVTQAEAKAQRLGSTLDRASGSSIKLAGEMVATGRSAAQMSAGFEAAGQRVTASAGVQRQGLQQLSFQLNDIATLFALGARPQQIFASQAGQVIQAVQQMTGGTSRLAAFLGGPWGLALTTATIVLAPFIGKLFEAEQAAELAEAGADALASAQTALGDVFDTVSGKLKTQNQLLLLNARLMALNLRADALSKRASSENALGNFSQGSLGLSTGQKVLGAIGIPVGGALRREGQVRGVVQDLDAGRISRDEALKRSEGLDFDGLAITKKDLQQAIIDSAVADANGKLADLIDKSLDSGRLAPELRTPGRSDRASPGRKGPKTKSAEEIADEFEDESQRLAEEELQLRRQLATSAEERASIAAELVGLERDQRLVEIEASDFSDAQKEELRKQVEALYGHKELLDEQGLILVENNRSLKAQLINREEAAERERDAQSLADERYDALRASLQLDMELADTDAERKRIALAMLEAEDAYLKSKLKAILLSDAANDIDKQRTQVALDALDATAAARREAVGRQNETESERYLRGLNTSSGQINEAIDGIKIDGLEALNDGLTDAILGAESLGDVFSRVADQIIADLLRIAIQQAIIRPLANALFGGGGGGGEESGGGLLGSLFAGLFAGGRADGGTIPTGKFAVVGEEGPELAFAGPGGLDILSNGDSRRLLSGGGNRGTNVMIPITIDATGADAAAIARLNSRLDRLQQELPGRIVTTVQDASNRRMINIGGGR